MPTGNRLDGAPKVFWTKGEQRKVADAAVRLMDADPKLKPILAVRTAQADVLGPGRQRTTGSLQSIGKLDWWPETYELAKAAYAKVKRREEREQAQALADAQSGIVPPAAEPAVESAQATPTPLPTRTPEPTPMPEPVAATPGMLTAFGDMGGLREMLVQELASVFVDAARLAMSRIASRPQVPQRPASANHAGGPSVSGSHTHPIDDINLSGTAFFDGSLDEGLITPVQEVKRAPVLVVGLRGQQHLDLEKHFQRRLDLRFVSADESKDKLREEADRCTCAVLMSNSVPPAWRDIVRARAKHIAEVTGGVIELRRTLTSDFMHLNGTH